MLLWKAKLIYIAVLQVWKKKVEQLGAEFVNHVSRRVTHIFAINSKALSERIGHEQLKKLKCVCCLSSDVYVIIYTYLLQFCEGYVFSSLPFSAYHIYRE